MMKIAILGATSQIAKDLVISLAAAGKSELYLFARKPDEVNNWLHRVGLQSNYPADDFAGLGKHEYDAIINFVGAGNPSQIVAMGNSIFDVTLQFDELALNYLRSHPNCRYLFLSSGAAYGSGFKEPARHDTPAVVPINNLMPHEWYGVAKMHAECRHRAHSDSTIFDLRVFNYFSRTQDISARFLITDILRAIRNKVVLQVTPDNIVRDFLHPGDFHKLVSALLEAPETNTAVDCYSKAPVDKFALLAAMQERFGLQYEITEDRANINATGGKPFYYSLNSRAADFGYQPGFTSLEGISLESSAILHAAA